MNFPIAKSSVISEMSTGKIYCHGVDKEGRPVLVWIASKNSVKERNLDETVNLLIWWAEYTIREKLPEHKSKVSVLVYMDGTSNDHVDKELYKRCLSLFNVSGCLCFPSLCLTSFPHSSDFSAVLSSFIFCFCCFRIFFQKEFIQ
jgi:hypothetical protein